MTDKNQLSLFDAEPIVYEGNWDDILRSYAFLYTSTEKGNNSGIRFMMSLEDAQEFCSSPKSRGVLHGTYWAYFFTSVYNYIHAKDCYSENKHPLSRVKTGCINLKGAADDNGKYDRLIEELGLKKINISEIPRFLKAFGIEVLI